MTCPTCGRSKVVDSSKLDRLYNPTDSVTVTHQGKAHGLYAYMQYSNSRLIRTVAFTISHIQLAGPHEDDPDLS